MRTLRPIFLACAAPLFALACSTANNNASDAQTTVPTDATTTPTDVASVTPDASASDANTATETGATDGAVPADATADVFVPLRPPSITRTDIDRVLADNRANCMYTRGAWPAATLGSDIPVGSDIPIDHILVLVQENRSFDHYFSKLKTAPGGYPDLEAAPDTFTNPDAHGAAVPRTHDTTYCIDDVDHGWSAVHTQYNNGAMDGFVTTNDPGGARALAYEDQTDLPFYYGLASTFAIGDHYHCSVLGPTWPNRFYFMSATSFGLAENTLLVSDTAMHPADTILHELDRAGYEWRDYAGGPRMLGFYPYSGLVDPRIRPHLKSIDNLMTDLASGDLPSFAFIEPNYTGNGGDRVDEHPPGMPQVGEQWVESIVRALMASPAWAHTALFITYDEHGGFADHVAPPAACPPDGNGPTVSGHTVPGAFDRLGMRVPFIVVSPYTKAHFVSHNTYSHTSVVRFVQARFGLPAMSGRDANSPVPMDMFDFAHPPFVTPPTIAGHSNPPAAARDFCRMHYASETGL